MVGKRDYLERQGGACDWVLRGGQPKVKPIFSRSVLCFGVVMLVEPEVVP